MPLREWAIDTIDKRAKFLFSEVQRAALLKRELPFKAASTDPLSQQLMMMQLLQQNEKAPAPPPPPPPVRVRPRLNDLKQE
jgi:hypothetical protein